MEVLCYAYTPGIDKVDDLCYNMVMNTKIQSILVRFLKGLASGAITAMVAVPLVMPKEWAGFTDLAQSLLMAGAFGGGVGLLLALQKWASWEE